MCLVVTSDDKNLSLDASDYDPAPVYHLLGTQDLDTCQHQSHTNFLGTHSYREPDRPDVDKNVSVPYYKCRYMYMYMHKVEKLHVHKAFESYK